MTTTARATLTHVTSPDGTRIAVHVSGEGRPLVAVHGTTSDHLSWRLVLPLLEPCFAVHAVDRRGRGGSGDRPEYSLDLEYADLAAVVDAAAAATGGPVDLIGHSYGGNVAFGAALLTSNIRRMVLYEGWPVPDIAHRTTPPEVMDRLESLLAQGRAEEMLEILYRDVVKMSEEEIAALEAARISVPVLLLVGGASPDEVRADPDVVAAALPDARIRVLEGQTHMAHLTAPETFAEDVLRFLD